MYDQNRYEIEVCHRFLDCLSCWLTRGHLGWTTTANDTIGHFLWAKETGLYGFLTEGVGGGVVLE